MEVELEQLIAAVIVRDPAQAWGGSPVFFARTEEEQNNVALLLGRILDGMVHDLENGVLIVVRH